MILKLVTLGRRFAAALVALAFAIGSPGVCAGWASTPEDRMACCAKGPCAMHGKAHGDSDSHPQQLTQSQSDGCCALSERDETNPSESFVLAVSLAPVTSPVAFALPAAIAPSLVAPDAEPPPGARLAKHLLLSVLLL